MNAPAPASIDFNSLDGKSAAELRQVFRSGAWQGTTAGLAGGYLQCNLVMLPGEYADAFAAFCQANPVPCPLLARSQPGVPTFSEMGDDIDLRYDLPAYIIYRDGEYSQTVPDVGELWTDDMCAFAIGCSFTFENALQQAGISLRHIERGTTVPMYRTSIACKPAGAFYANTVVSMRPIQRDEIDRVYEICARFPQAHGKPIHTGDPGKIGIADPNAPDWGIAVPVRAGEVPVFWGCGVTTQVAVQNACPPTSFTHAPGAMLITDISTGPQ